MAFLFVSNNLSMIGLNNLKIDNLSLRNDYEVKECAVYVILGYDLHGHKEILGV